MTEDKHIFCNFFFISLSCVRYTRNISLYNRYMKFIRSYNNYLRNVAVQKNTRN